MGNDPQVRQDLLPAAGDFLLVTAGAHPPSSSDTPLSLAPLQMISIIISPINCFAPVEYWHWQKQAKHSIVRLSVAIWWC
jgi:hypothetical protein